MPQSLMLRSSVLLFLMVSLIVLLDSREVSQDLGEDFLDGSYPLHLIHTLKANVGPGGDFAFGSRDVFPQVEAAFIMEDETQATKVWPRVIQEYMRHQFRFRGRTKKSANLGYHGS
ncbi:uncharacterized protein V6R79_025117 [Siganus canaliculatus]